MEIKKIIDANELVVHEQISIDEQIKDILSKIDSLKQLITDASLLSKFDHISKNLLPAIVEWTYDSTGGVCAGCHMKILGTLQEEIKEKQDTIVSCDYCGRMIYLPKKEFMFIDE